MKIIYDNIIYWLQKSGGGSVYWTELAKRLEKSDEVEALFYEPKEPNDNIFRKGLVFKNRALETFLSLKIRRYLNFTKPIEKKTIFHSSYFRVSKSKNAINVTTIHDFTTEKFRTGLARWVNLQQKKYAVLNSQGIICISENTKKDLLEFVPNVDKSKIRVIYNGVSEDFYLIENDFQIKDKEPRFHSLENYKYLLYIGHRTSYKNFDIAVKAAAKTNGKYKLVVIGEPFSEEEQIEVDKLLGRENYIQVSKLGNEHLNMLYNKAFALLYPSSYEGFGIPLVEAMKTGCPVIANNTSSIPEVAGDAAILIDDIDEHKICEQIKNLEDQEYRDKLIEKGFIQSQKFNWDKTFEEYMKFYKELYNEG